MKNHNVEFKEFGKLEIFNRDDVNYNFLAIPLQNKITNSAQHYT